MFESSTFDSMGTIHTRSRNWMFATFGFNASILALLVAIPLLRPAMLPPILNPIVVEPPSTPVEQPKPIEVQQTTSAAQQSGAQMFTSPLTAPPTIPIGIGKNLPEPQIAFDSGSLSRPGGLPGMGCDPFNCNATHPDVRQVTPSVAHVSKGVMEGRLLNNILPIYPALARAMHMSGRVELQATISRGGTIENLRVMSGPTIFQQAALDAVRQWRYQPYLLNGQPVEVETTIEVDFAMN